MRKFIRLPYNIEIEILPKENYFKFDSRKSPGAAKEDLRNRGFRLPTVKELGYIHNLLYLNYGGNFVEGSEYWASDIYDPEMEGKEIEAHRTVTMVYRGTPSSKYNYSRMPYIGVRDV
jgi:hypothetical protein